MYHQAEKIYQILARNCNKDDDFFWKEVQKRSRADWFVTPSKAKKIGLADYIGMPRLKITVDVDIDLEKPKRD